jgi:hypothetical protein
MANGNEAGTMTVAPDRIACYLVDRDPDDPGPGMLVDMPIFVDGEFAFALEYEPDAAIELAAEILSSAQAAKRPVELKRPPTEAQRVALRKLFGGGQP